MTAKTPPRVEAAALRQRQRVERANALRAATYALADEMVDLPVRRSGALVDINAMGLPPVAGQEPGVRAMALLVMTVERTSRATWGLAPSEG